MRSLLVSACACAASLVAAQDLQDLEPSGVKDYDHPVDTGSDEYWWSRNPDDGIGPKPAGYKAVWEQCGHSCDAEDCGILDSTLCFSYKFNSCYSPFFGETCCEDMYGTTCEQYYTCAYDTKGQAYCCDLENSDLDSCGKALNVTLRAKSQVPPSSQLPVSTLVQYRLPPGGSRPSSEPSKNLAPQREEKPASLSVGAIAGTAVGAFVFLCLLAGVILYVLRRRKRAVKYGILPAGSTIHAPPGVGTYVPPDAKHFQHDAAEVDSLELPQPRNHEMPPNPLVEMGERDRNELDGKGRKPELAATQDEMTFELDASGDTPRRTAKSWDENEGPPTRI